MITCTQGAIGGTGEKPTTFFSGWDFNSMAKVNGIPLGANSDGIFQLNTTEKDAGVNYTRTITFATSDFNIDNNKLLIFLYFGFITNYSFTVEVKFDDGSWNIYSIVPASSGLQRRRLMLDMNSRGFYHTIRVSSTTAFKLNYIKGLITIRPSGLVGY